MDARALIGVFGSLVTLGIFVITAVFRLGQHASRIEALEEWRKNIRMDMHEISEHMQGLSRQMTEIKTLLEERTERRIYPRDQSA